MQRAPVCHERVPSSSKHSSSTEKYDIGIFFLENQSKNNYQWQEEKTRGASLCYPIYSFHLKYQCWILDAQTGLDSDVLIWAKKI